MVAVFAIIGVTALALSHADTDKNQVVAGKLRIMPMGDDLTDGSPTYPGAYRTVLWQKLVGQDGLTVDYVGSQSNGDDSLSDKDHEGHAGWNMEQLNHQAAGWIQNYQPDVVLLGAGTSDLQQGASAATASQRLDSLLTTITTAKPDIHVLVSSLTPLDLGGSWDSQQWQAYNGSLQSLTSKYRSKGFSVSLVDMGGAGLSKGLPDIADGSHPTAGGYAKMAEEWYPAVLSQFNK
jgi:lysophospholipase L1-like esterase